MSTLNLTVVTANVGLLSGSSAIKTLEDRLRELVQALLAVGVHSPEVVDHLDLGPLVPLAPNVLGDLKIHDVATVFVAAFGLPKTHASSPRAPFSLQH